MGKSVLIALGCSVFIILAFLGGLYLMSTVNPDPLPNIRLDQSVEPIQSHESDPAQLMQAAPYELVKIDGDVTDFYTSKMSGSYPNSGRKVVPPIWPRRNQEIITPTIHKVMPPIWPTSSVPSETDLTPRSIKQDQYEVTTSKQILSSTKADVKSRKSRSNYRSNEDVGSITLDIFNNTGKPRIEIKLYPKGFLKKKKAKRNKHAKNKSVFLRKPEYNNDLEDNSHIANHTVINICGNDSIVIDESGDLDILKLIEIIKSFTLDAMNNNTKITNENMKTLPLNKNASDEMFVRNKTESFNYKTENNSNINFNTSNVKDINDRNPIEPMKGDVSDIKVTNLDIINATKMLKGVKNSSEIDTQMNNKEYNKIVFGDEVKTSHAPNNITILVSDIIQSNITDLYIENDSDIIY